MFATSFLMSGRDDGRRASQTGARPENGRRTQLRPRESRTLRLHGLMAALLLALAAVVVPVPASAAPGDVGFEGLSHSGTGTPTGTKRSTSNLWFHDGIWWGNLWDTASQDFEIFRFNPSTSQWTSTGVTTETRSSTHHDVLWDGTTLYVASYRFVNDGVAAAPNYPTTLRRYSYNSGAYTLLDSSQINNYRVEALTIDKEPSGRLWATWQQGNRIYLNVTATDGKTWGTPFPHPASLSNVSIDDTSSVIAFGENGENKIGVMWSRQVGDATDGMYWSVHADGAAKTDWSSPVAAVKGARSGDDHMNLKWLDASSGKVFAAIKTSFTSASQPLIQLLALDNATSAWTAHTIATVAECPNRVIVLIDEAAQRLRTFATYPKPSGTTNAGVCTSSGGAIYEKSAALSEPAKLATAQKIPRIVDADQYVHNVTSTKQNLNSSARGTANSGVLLLADVNATSRYWHSYEAGSGSGGGTPDTTAPTVTSTSPVAGATGVAVTANVTGTFSEAMDASTVASSTFTLTPAASGAVSLDSTGKTATLNPGADLAAGTVYTATIKGGTSGVKDLAGNALASDKTWTFTTAPAGTADTTPPTVTSTTPVLDATGVAPTTNVTGTFSEPMNGSTVTSSTFTLTPAPAGTNSVSYNSANNTATFDPGTDLAPSTTYTATIKGGASGVKDAAGNALASDKTWTFTTAAPSAGGTTVTLTATADSYVLSGSTTNFGTSTLLAVDNSPLSITYLKFDLTPYAGRTITGATLQLRSSTSGSAGTQNVKVAGDGWSETSITYSNRAAVGAVLGTFGPTTINTNYSITLAPGGLAGEPGGELSLAVDSTSSDGLDLSSREASSGAYAPKLVLTFQ